LTIAGVGFGAFAVQYLAFKLAARDVVAQLLEPFMRMPCVYPYYLLFCDLHGFVPLPVLSLLTAGQAGDRTQFPIVIARFVSPDASREFDAYQPAPAHVIWYAEGGLLTAVFVLLLVGFAIWACGKILENYRSSTLGRAFGATCCCAIYMLSQADIDVLFFQSWGVVWALVPCLLIYLLSIVPREGQRPPKPAITRVPNAAAAALRFAKK
jgi:hypothetical protein